MAKVDNQFNLFGTVGQVSEAQVAVAAGTEPVEHYLKCQICRWVSGSIMIPPHLLTDPGKAQRFAMAEAGWRHECPACCKPNGKCPSCAKVAA